MGATTVWERWDSPAARRHRQPRHDDLVQPLRARRGGRLAAPRRRRARPRRAGLPPHPRSRRAPAADSPRPRPGTCTPYGEASISWSTRRRRDLRVRVERSGRRHRPCSTSRATSRRSSATASTSASLTLAEVVESHDPHRVPAHRRRRDRRRSSSGRARPCPTRPFVNYLDDRIVADLGDAERAASVPDRSSIWREAANERGRRRA